MRFLPQFLLTPSGNACFVSIAGVAALVDLLLKFHTATGSPEYQQFGIAVSAILAAISYKKASEK